MELLDAGLKTYPFAIVPPLGPTLTWADRKSFRQDLDQLVKSWRLRPGSAVYLLWADFGAGKTHALRYLEGLGSRVSPPAICIYSDLPDGADDFREVFRQIMPAIPTQVLTRAIFAFRQRHRADWLDVPLLRGDRDTPRVLWVFAQEGSPMQREVAGKWLRGERLYSREAAQLENIPPIRTADQAIRVLSAICRIILDSANCSRLVLMLDEFQRIGQVSKRKIADINAGIGTLINTCPERLAILLSYSFGVPENIKYFVAPEVQNRVEKRFHLPALTVPEAVEFVEDLLRLDSLDSTVQRVFEPAGVLAVVQQLRDDSNGKLLPRGVMQAFATILDTALNSPQETFPLSKVKMVRSYTPPHAD